MKHLLGLVLLLVACSDGRRSRPPRPGTYYVGTHRLDLLQTLSPDAPVTATLRFGQPVTVIDRRRRFARIRTEAGAEGWVDSWNLLTPAKMARLTQLAMTAATLPSQGKATCWQELNVHTEPHRDAPAFARISEGILVDVLAGRVVPRRPYDPEAGEPPSLPVNSYELPDVNGNSAKPADEWTLVRLPGGLAGWTLSRMLTMAVPAELSAYAEGRSITSYFSLGRIQDGAETRQAWLWTTRSQSPQSYQFDRLQVFTWNVHRHRYETVYLERGIYGYYPMEVEPLSADAAGLPAARFKAIVYRPAEGFVRQTYLFDGRSVRKLEAERWNPPASPDSLPQRATDSPEPGAHWWSRLTQWFAGLFNE